MNKTITLNQAQRLYVVPNAAGGYNTWGFEVIHRKVVRLCHLLSVALPDAAVGSVEMYRAHETLTQRFATHPASAKTWFTPDTDPKVERILQRAINANPTVVLRLFYGDVQTGRDWCEEWSVVGAIGRTGGIYKVPLVLEALRDSNGERTFAKYGDSINTKSVLRIIDVDSGRELYRHESYQVPEFEVRASVGTAAAAGLDFSVIRLEADGTQPNVANFKTRYQADDYIAFMRGHKPCMPLRSVAQARQDLEEA